MDVSGGLVVTEKEAASLTTLSVRSLQKLRVDGGGPRFVKLTGRRIGYLRSDIQAWLQARLASSTSAASRGAGGLAA
jgi:predicted DNA-binding transcriptional regulator AlpA